MPHLSTELTITVRVPPQEDFSWIDRLFLREYAERLTGEAIALYLILGGRQTCVQQPRRTQQAYGTDDVCHTPSRTSRIAAVVTIRKVQLVLRSPSVWPALVAPS